MIPELHPSDEITTPQPKRPKVSYRSVMTKDITALLISNFAMCLASEALFTVYPLFAFTPIESGTYENFTGMLNEPPFPSIEHSSFIIPPFRLRGSILHRKPNRRIPRYPCRYTNRHHVPFPHDPPEPLHWTGFGCEIIPDRNVCLARNSDLLSPVELACAEEGDGSNQWMGL